MYRFNHVSHLWDGMRMRSNNKASQGVTWSHTLTKNEF